MRYIALFALLASLASCGDHHLLKEVVVLPHYPSASGISFINNRYYLMGDDAPGLLIVDQELNPIDSIKFFNTAAARISKADKADIEAVTIVDGNKLLAIGSGSLSPYRNKAWIIDPGNKHVDTIQLDQFYQRMQQAGIREVNVEGACMIPGGVILSNRGNKTYPKNYLVLTSRDFWKNQLHAPIVFINAGCGKDSAVFNGVSDIVYASKSDRLIMTVSTEDTRNSLEDGAIGKSYIWIIENISSKKNWKAINPDQVIDLEEVDARFKGQKVEAVAISKETRNFFHLLLAADNDNGSSTLFKLIIEKN